MLTSLANQMSGGNTWKVSDFGVASKWFFNWVTDSSVISMQPQGQSTSCPTCSSSGKFTITAFDDVTTSPQSGKMAIHVPITTAGKKTYSYWFSYRSGIRPAAEGLSIHLGIFMLGGPVGASYDSVSYDAGGNTPSRWDSFVLPNTCYHVSPSSFMKVTDIIAVEATQPVICVESIDIGKSVTVSVSFLDPQNPPSPSRQLNNIHHQCSSSDQNALISDINPSKYNLIHVTSTGEDGVVDLDLCPSNRNSMSTITSAFFYDE